MNAQKVLQTVWAHGSPSGTICNHGFDSVVINHVERPVCSFIEACWSENFIPPAVMRSYLAHREVWDNDSYRTTTIDILTIIGTNMLLNEEVNISWPLNIALAIIGLEHYGSGIKGDMGFISIYNSHYPATKVRDYFPAATSNRRDALKFFRKRASCSCLKALHLLARKSQPKMGVCLHCTSEKERVLLSVCGRCKVTQYCSKECQVAASSRHRKDCDRYVMHEQYNKSRIDA